MDLHVHTCDRPEDLPELNAATSSNPSPIVFSRLIILVVTDSVSSGDTSRALKSGCNPLPSRSADSDLRVQLKTLIFSRGCATLELAVSVGRSVSEIFDFRRFPLLPTHPRLYCRVSGLVFKTA